MNKELKDLIESYATQLNNILNLSYQYNKELNTILIYHNEKVIKVIEGEIECEAFLLYIEQREIVERKII